jgi:NADPH2 dehydrogenase
VREIWSKERALGIRINATDWVEGGWQPEDAVLYAKALERIGLDFICVSSGATVPHARIPVTPGYQVGFAEKIKAAVSIPIRAVGMIADPEQAEEILASGKADMVAMARAFLDNPRWVWHAAERFGVKIDYPPQYARSRPDQWPGATLARPRESVAGE